MDIKTAANRCIDDLGLAQNTKDTYRKGIQRFREYLLHNKIQDTEDVSKITMDHFIYFLPWIDKGHSRQTTRVYGSAAKAFLDWLVIEKFIEPTYYDTVRFNKAFQRSHKRHEYKLPRFPKKDDVDKMQKAVKLRETPSPQKERDIALIETLASTGCRISEVINLNIQDVDTQTRSAIVTGKGDKQRRVFFSPEAMEALNTYWVVRKSNMPTHPVFIRHDKGTGKKIQRMTPTTARRIVKEVAVLAGIDPSKFSPHYFRHAFAIRVLSEKGNLALAQDLLGHKDPKATRVYAKIHADDLREAHRDIFG